MQTITAVGLLLTLAAAAMPAADARGGHGHGGGHSHGAHAGANRGGGLAADKRHADDPQHQGRLQRGGPPAQHQAEEHLPRLLGRPPAKPRQDRAAHDPVLVAFGEERKLFGELRHALPVGGPAE